MFVSVEKCLSCLPLTGFQYFFLATKWFNCRLQYLSLFRFILTLLTLVTLHKILSSVSFLLSVWSGCYINPTILTFASWQTDRSGSRVRADWGRWCWGRCVGYQRAWDERRWRTPAWPSPHRSPAEPSSSPSQFCPPSVRTESGPSLFSARWKTDELAEVLFLSLKHHIRIWTKPQSESSLHSL